MGRTSVLWSHERSQTLECVAHGESNQGNMITVDPKSEGLAAYYKLNGTDQFQDGETWKVKDASGHGMDGLVNGGDKALGIVELDEPITIK